MGYGDSSRYFRGNFEKTKISFCKLKKASFDYKIYSCYNLRKDIAPVILNSIFKILPTSLRVDLLVFGLESLMNLLNIVYQEIKPSESSNL